MLRGQRRTTPPRRAWGTRTLPWATAGFLCATGLVGAGAGPAGASSPPAAAPVQRAFSPPAHSATVNGFCQPKPTRQCPTANSVWSGYVVSPQSGHQITTVSASWVQTHVTCPKPDAWVLFWVGIDGWSQIGNATVEQGGSSAQCTPGSPVDYEAWWEMYPTNDVQTVFPIAVGDHMASSVVFSSADDSYTISVTDNTSRKSFVVVASVPDNSYTIALDGGSPGPPISFAATTSSAVVCAPGSPCMNSSAEWIVEAPGGNSGGGLYPLARFRPVTFTSALAADSVGDQGSITTKEWLSTALDLATTTGTNQAKVSGLRNQGKSFRDEWLHA